MKSTLTTLSVAAALAIGGIAVAQTSGDTAAGTNAQDQSQSTTLSNSGTTGSSDLGSTATTENSSSPTMSSDTSTMGNTGSSNSSLDASAPVAQIDRN